MSLSPPAIREFSVIQDAQALWDAWLNLWFDGANHPVGGGGDNFFPQCNFFHQQTDMTQPLDGQVIHVIQKGSTQIRRCWEAVSGTLQQRAYDSFRVEFWVRAAGASSGAGNAQYRAEQVAGLLTGLLRNSAATLDLAEKGIRRLSAQDPMPIISPLYDIRLVQCRGEFHYNILSQG